MAPVTVSSKLVKSEYLKLNNDDSENGSSKPTSFSNAKRIGAESMAQFIPVVFAVFINLLDACTFGTVFFPSKLGSDMSGLAIELFLLSTVVVQLVLIRMSSFSCGLGTAMAENVPFVHSMSLGIFDSLEHTHPNSILPTVLVTVCLSTIINGALFFVVGYFKMGHVLHFFPRHVIMGMTAGFGVFLLSTAVESSTGIVMADQTISSFLYALTPSRCCQLALVTTFEVILRLIDHLKCNELVVPGMMFLLPLAFYTVLAVSGTSFQQARGSDWLFPETPSANWWDTWLLFDFSLVQWKAVAGQWATLSSLAFFTLILVPIRIPSLSIITGDDVDFDEELKAQGIANIFSGLIGAVHNYLSYSNSIFFHVVGGRGKSSQFAITLLTLLLFFVGPQIINYVPRLIAGAIMLHLGVDLVVGGLVTSRKVLDSLEYSSVIFIATVVSFMGFVPGLGMGVVSACVTFVVQSSRQSSIRAVFSGDTARSNTSWSSRQRDKLDIGIQGGSSIFVVQLQGHLFFGNEQQVVQGIERALKLNLSAEEEMSLAVTTTQQCQLQYLILDCSFVTGADVNAVTGLLKMRDHIASQYNSKRTGNTNPNPNPSQYNSKRTGNTHTHSRDIESKKDEVQVNVIFAGP
jgi:SulP family sulfate permease